MRYPESLSGDMSLVLPEFEDPPSDPMALLRDWIAAAEQAEVREPRAVSLATADSSGRVWARTVVVKIITEDAIVLGFSAESRKGRDIAANPYAALNFYWRERAQQITVSGPIVPADADTSDAVFAARPRPAQALAARSTQSGPTDDLTALREAVARLDDAGTAIPRPASWSAWSLRPDQLEFFHGALDRFHRRLGYQRDATGYRSQRLQP